MAQEMVSRHWRSAFFGSVGLGLLAVAFLGYGVVDQAITITYMSDGYDRTKADLQHLAAAFPRERYNKKDILVVLRRNEPKALIVETPCSIQLDGLRFEFDRPGTLINIDTRAEYSATHECGV